MRYMLGLFNDWFLKMESGGREKSTGVSKDGIGKTFDNYARLLGRIDGN